MQKTKTVVEQGFPSIRKASFRVQAKGKMILYLKYSERFRQALAASQGAAGMHL